MLYCFLKIGRSLDYHWLWKYFLELYGFPTGETLHIKLTLAYEKSSNDLFAKWSEMHTIYSPSIIQGRHLL